MRAWYRSWHRTYQIRRAQTGLFPGVAPDKADEKALLKSVRRQASLPEYNVQDDIAEMVIQFGYLALFSPVWPLVSIGFLINNWIELRSDFLKICFEHQRPAPKRAEGIGPWIDSLDTLTLLGSISTAAIVHLFGVTTPGNGNTMFGLLPVDLSWWSLPVTIFVSEHIFLSLRALVRFLLQRIGSNLLRRERNERYMRRQNQWNLLSTRAKTESRFEAEVTPNKHADGNVSYKPYEEEGIEIIRALKEVSGGPVFSNKSD
jgi:anoctamin-10